MRRFCFGRLVGLISGGVLAGVASAANLVGNGDFAADGEKAGANYRATGGTFAVFTETPSWNRCGKYVLGEPTTSKDGEVCSMGYVFCGYDPASKLAGFKAEPDTSYAFSFEIRGDAPSVSVAFYEWDGPDFWNDGHKGETSVKSVTPKKDEWTLVKGTFRTSQKAQRAALRFGLYSSSKYKMKPLSAGTSYLIDNVKVEPVKNRLASVGEVKEVPVRKAFATADGGMLSDFCMMKGSLLKPTFVAVSQSAKGLVFDVSCRGQDAVTHAKGDRLWTADSFEILFGDPAAPSVKLLQFAFNVDGQKYVSDGSTVLGWNDRWSVATKTCADGWEAKVEIPYATLGYERSPRPA